MRLGHQRPLKTSHRVETALLYGHQTISSDRMSFYLSVSIYFHSTFPFHSAGRADFLTFFTFHLSQLLTKTQETLQYISRLGRYLLFYQQHSKRSVLATIAPDQLHPTIKHLVHAASKRRRNIIVGISSNIRIKSVNTALRVAETHKGRLRTLFQLNNSLFPPPLKDRTLPALQTPRTSLAGPMLLGMRRKWSPGQRS